jgi:non-ribosomal peptide synthetase component F
MEILEREFQQIYRAMQQGKETLAEDKPLKIGYKDFAAWHNWQLEHAPHKEISHRYWKEFLKGNLPVLRLPRDFDDEGKEKPGKPGGSNRLVIPGEIKDLLNRISREHRITLFALMYSVYTLWLSLVTGQAEVVTIILNAGRDHPQHQDLVGFFINTVIFKSEINPEDEFIDYAIRTRDRMQEFFRHQYYPLELVLEEVGNRYPEVPVSFNMLNIHNTETIALENRGTPLYEIPNVKFDLEPFVSEYRDGILIDVLYNRGMFKAENIEYLMKKYGEMVEFFARDPGKRLKDYKESKKRKTFKRVAAVGEEERK